MMREKLKKPMVHCLRKSVFFYFADMASRRRRERPEKVAATSVSSKSDPPWIEQKFINANIGNFAMIIIIIEKAIFVSECLCSTIVHNGVKFIFQNVSRHTFIEETDTV